jgi:tetratricopeptide (TPR) repeat protein
MRNRTLFVPVSGFRFPVSAVRLLLIMLPLVISVSSAFAQTITLKTGQKVETLGVRRDGAIIMGKVQVGSGEGEIGYNVAQIAHIDFPEPRGLKTASDLLAQNQPQKALAEIDQVIAYYDAFREVPGSWWTQAALIKLSTLSALQRDKEAESLAQSIEKSATDPDTARLVRVNLAASLIRRNELEKAMGYCDSAIKESTNPHVLAEAWLYKGDAFAGLKQWDDALLAYLHIPVFYGDETGLLPHAMLGSARAYRRVDDPARAKKTFNELIAAYPNSPEATVAANELRKIKTP